MTRKRIVVAMSGGVDSSVAAALLSREGHEVIGITLRLWTPSPWNNGERYGGCCSPQDIADAKEVCAQLGIPHYTFDLEEKFKENVVDDFVSEYLAGKTPNPCVRCNAFIKFDVLLKYVVALNADALATGHYARVENSDSGYRLCKAGDLSKDQSYFLYMLNQDQLSRLSFPLGTLTKDDVRKLAEEFGLVTACKQDSQDVCFLEGRNYREFIKERVPDGKISRGSIQTADGRKIGEHEGLPFYTIGQREKLGVSVGKPLYVIAKDPVTNSLIVGSEGENLTSECSVRSVSWCSGIPPEGFLRASVKVRYRHPGALSSIESLSRTECKIVFESPQSSITPGQSAVFYSGDQVLGGGVISTSPPFTNGGEKMSPPFLKGD